MPPHRSSLTKASVPPKRSSPPQASVSPCITEKRQDLLTVAEKGTELRPSSLLSCVSCAKQSLKLTRSIFKPLLLILSVVLND